MFMKQSTCEGVGKPHTLFGPQISPISRSACAEACIFVASETMSVETFFSSLNSLDCKGLDRAGVTASHRMCQDHQREMLLLHPSRSSSINSVGETQKIAG